jgi:hypothetical protein
MAMKATTILSSVTGCAKKSRFIFEAQRKVGNQKTTQRKLLRLEYAGTGEKVKK